jgi:hypothetical protein
MVSVAMEHLRRGYQEDPSQIPPEVYLKGDREYTRKLNGWIDTKDMEKTKSLLYGVVAIQGNTISRGRENHGRLINMDRRTIQRLSKRADLVEIQRFLMVDAVRLMVRPACAPREIIDTIISAEMRYKHSPNRHFVRKRRIKSKTFLAIQLPNHYFSKHDIKEVPATREAIGWFRSGTSVRACCHDMTRTRIALPGWPSDGIFSDSRTMGADENLVKLHAKRLDDILSVDELRDYVLTRTGAEDIRPALFTRPFIWYPASSAAPYEKTKSTKLAG